MSPYVSYQPWSYMKRAPTAPIIRFGKRSSESAAEWEEQTPSRNIRAVRKWKVMDTISCQYSDFCGPSDSFRQKSAIRRSINSIWPPTSRWGTLDPIREKGRCTVDSIWEKNTKN
jgi:hypothetical protein